MKMITTIYRLSKSNLHDHVLSPYIPINFFTSHGYEDNRTKRLCFATSIDGCLTAMSQNLKDQDLYVHIPVGNYKIYIPTKDEVPDCELTGERWITHMVKVECIGKIKVSTSKDEPLDYIYSDKNGITYRWNYKWLEKYDYDEFDKQIIHKL